MCSAIKNSFDIKTGGIHIWSSQAVMDIHRLAEFSKLLSEDEVTRANKFRFEKDRSVYITAKYLLRTLLGNYLNTNPREIIFEYSEFDKPSYSNDKNIDFNVSHSGDRIIIGFVKDQCIGVDIEKIKEDFDVLELAENFFSKEEIKALSQAQGSERYQAFYRCWTRKEAFIKAVGEGLTYPLDSFAVTMDNDIHANFLKIDNSRESEKKWHLHSFVPASGYIAALTTDSNPNSIEYFNTKDFFPV